VHREMYFKPNNYSTMGPVSCFFITSGFRKILRLSEPTLNFRGEDCNMFLKNHDNGLDLFPKFLEDLMIVPEDVTRLQVSSSRNLFWEIAWFFTRITGQESSTSISHMILNILYFTIKEQIIFYWGEFNFY
jgi:hypothetical protein